MTWEARQAQAQQVKVLADNLSWMPETNIGSRELIPASCLLILHRLHGSQVHMHIQTHPTPQHNKYITGEKIILQTKVMSCLQVGSSVLLLQYHHSLSCLDKVHCIIILQCLYSHQIIMLPSRCIFYLILLDT